MRRQGFGNDLVVALGYGARRVFGMEEADEVSHEADALGIHLIPHLIACAPDDHGRVIAVSADEVHDVLPPVLFEVKRIAGRGLFFGYHPFIHKLVHHQKAQLVAQIHKLVRTGIVRRADAVRSHFFEQPEASLPYLVGHGGSQASGVVVQVDAVYLHPLPVQQEALFGAELQRADPEAGIHLVDCPAADLDSRPQRVEDRGFDRPQHGRPDGQLLPVIIVQAPGQDGHFGFFACNHLSAGIQHLGA